MNIETFASRLETAALEAGWVAERVDTFTATRFRGREDVTVQDPMPVLGLRLGNYPVLAVALKLEDLGRMRRDLKRLHGQMVVARSYMSQAEVINAHIFVCATVAVGDHDWRAVIDFAERDERVCRKLIWPVQPRTLEASWQAFLDRTFLAQPWDEGGVKLDARLDTSASLSVRILEDAGLTPAQAKAWVRLAAVESEDPQTRVGQMVDALGPTL